MVSGGRPTLGHDDRCLNSKHGAWGLAYLEALVRLSDWLQSQREQGDAAHG